MFLYTHVDEVGVLVHTKMTCMYSNKVFAWSGYLFIHGRNSVCTNRMYRIYWEVFMYIKLIITHAKRSFMYFFFFFLSAMRYQCMYEWYVCVNEVSVYTIEERCLYTFCVDIGSMDPCNIRWSVCVPKFGIRVLVHLKRMFVLCKYDIRAHAKEYRASSYTKIMYIYLKIVKKTKKGKQDQRLSEWPLRVWYCKTVYKYDIFEK